MANEEIMGGPFEVYVAPSGTLAPPIQDAVPAPWVLHGVNGNKNITEDGVRIAHEVEGEPFHALGTTAARKWFPVRENLHVMFELADMSPEMYAYALGKPESEITSVAAASGIAGMDSLPFERGFTVNQFACLIRGDQSPAGAGFNTQWWIPLVVQQGSPEIVIVKGVPQLLAFDYMILHHDTLGVGEYQVQTAAELA